MPSSIYLLLFYLNICLSAHRSESLYTCAHAHKCICKSDDSLKWLSLGSFLWFWNRASHSLAWSLPIRQDGLAGFRKPPLLPQSGMASGTHHARASPTWALRTNPGPHACKANTLPNGLSPYLIFFIRKQKVMIEKRKIIHLSRFLYQWFHTKRNFYK